MGIVGDAWDWTKGAAGSLWTGAGQTLGLTDESSEITKNRGPDGPYATPYAAYDPNKFDPSQQDGYGEYRNAAAVQGSQGVGSYTAGMGQMRQGYDAPQTTLTGQVNAPAPIQAPTTGTSATNYGAGVQQSNDSRSMQQNAAGMFGSAAVGQGPSVAPGMLRENAANAAAGFGQAGSAANQGYGNAATGANLAYGNAAAGQQQAAQQSAADAARMMKDATAESIQAQSALTASGRGGNMAAALLQGQNNAALQTAQGNTQAARAFADVMRGANADAAGMVRQGSAQQQEQMANLQATAERAGMEVARAREAGDYRAAQIASQEQQAAMEQYASMTNNIRGADLQGAGLGSQIDQMIQSGDMANADRTLKANGMNADMAFQAGQLSAANAISIAQMNGDWQSANNVLMGDLAKTMASMGIQMQQAQMEAMAGLVQTNLAAGMAFEEAKAAAFNEAKNRGANFDIGATNAGIAGKQQNMDMIGGVAKTFLPSAGGGASGGGAAGASSGAAAGGGGGAGIAAMLGSDVTAKDIIGPGKVPDFRSALPHQYTYKPGAFLDEEGNDEYDTSEVFDGPMAQDLPLDTRVKDASNGDREKVDTGRLILSMATALGESQRRLDALDGGGPDATEAAPAEEDDALKYLMEGAEQSAPPADLDAPLPPEDDEQAETLKYLMEGMH